MHALLSYSLLVVAVVVAVAILGIDLGVLISCNFDEIVPVHDWPYLVLEPICLFDLLVGCNHHALVFHFLARPLSAVVKQRQTHLLCFVLSYLVLLYRPLFLLADPAHIEFLCFNLSALFDFLLVGEDKELFGHGNLVDGLDVHG